jgi:hypothetical protein
MVMSGIGGGAVPSHTDYELSVYEMSTRIQRLRQEESGPVEDRFSATPTEPTENPAFAAIAVFATNVGCLPLNAYGKSKLLCT